MKQCRGRPIGACSWSFQKDIGAVAEAMVALEIEHIHLALSPALGADGGAYVDFVRKQTWTITSTMLSFDHEDYSTLETIQKTGGIVPDEHWETARTAFYRAADLTRELGVPFISLHAGFLDHANPQGAQKLIERTLLLADYANKQGLTLLLETGQETAAELLEFLKAVNRMNVGLNFDPANMILYNKDNPIDAVRVLAPFIRHVHIKDAVRTKIPGTWGSEVPWGDGEVGVRAFLDVLGEVNFAGALAIEREAGTQRQEDIALAVSRLVEV